MSDVQPAGNILTYNKNDYMFPLSHRQWFICQLFLAKLYQKNTTNLQLIKDVYSTCISQSSPLCTSFASPADFRMKLRRVFGKWSHDVLGSRNNIDSGLTNARAQQLHSTEGLSDKLYCFFSTVHRTFFEHNRRQASGSRRKPICKDFPARVLAQLKGDPNSKRREDFVSRWNKIGKKIRDGSKMIIPPLVVERAGIQITTKVYSTLSSVRDILYHSSFVDDYQIVSWSEKLIDDIMEDNEEIHTLEQWLCTEYIKGKTHSLPLIYAVYNLSYTVSSTTEITKFTKEAKAKATQATRQLIRSTINLRMKQVLRADKSLSCGKHEQTFRAVIAVLGGTERKQQEIEIKEKNKKVKKKVKNKKVESDTKKGGTTSSSSSSSSKRKRSSKKGR